MNDFKSFLSWFVKPKFHLIKRKALSFLLKIKYFIFVFGSMFIISAFFENQFREFLLMFIVGVQWVGTFVIFITNANKIKKIPLIRTNKKFPFHFHFKNSLKILLYLLVVLVSHVSAMSAFFAMTLVIADVIRDLNFEDAAFASTRSAFFALVSLFIPIPIDS
jgi:xanthine/uracil permease